MPTGPACAIEPVDPDDRAAMDGWFALLVRCHAQDTPVLPRPCPLGHATLFSWPGRLRRAWVVREGTIVVAAAHLSLSEHDDLDNGFAHVLVAPGHRRRGLGTRLLRHVGEQARAAGRTRLILGAGEAPDAPGPGAAFLRDAGARLGLVEMCRRLVLPPRDPAALRELAAEAGRAARGYRLVQWTGPTPPRWRDDIAVLVARMSTDAPTGELTVGPQRWDAERIRERDAAAVANGVRSVVTAAQDAGGRLVAFTEASTCAVEDGFATQGDTLVAPAHRGHRLGLWVKLANLELLVQAHPEVRAIDTFNADDNRWMIAVNEAMGFGPLWRVTDWELDLAELGQAEPERAEPERTGGQAGTIAAISAAASGP
jgi:GNAT superfamily N-acetyltransferase